jgi:hypothetical protein
MQDPEVLAKLPWVKTVYETQAKTFEDGSKVREWQRTRSLLW